jgi:hypothetical protein
MEDLEIMCGWCKLDPMHGPAANSCTLLWCTEKLILIGQRTEHYTYCCVQLSQHEISGSHHRSTVCEGIVRLIQYSTSQ